MNEELADAAESIGFHPDEIDTAGSTRSARLKWVVIVDEALPVGRMVNAVACIAAATGAGVSGLIARGGSDGDGAYHQGLPWAGCTVLQAPAEVLAQLREKASAAPDVFVADMPTPAQTHRVYDDYLHELRETPAAKLGLHAIGLVGPRNRVDKWVKRLSLL